MFPFTEGPSISQNTYMLESEYRERIIESCPWELNSYDLIRREQVSWKSLSKEAIYFRKMLTEIKLLIKELLDCV